MKKKQLDNYEEGVFAIPVQIRTGKRGRPKTVEVVYGIYKRIGKVVNVSLKNGINITGVEGNQFQITGL